jgi:hypothetical protein
MRFHRFTNSNELQKNPKAQASVILAAFELPLPIIGGQAPMQIKPCLGLCRNFAFSARYLVVARKPLNRSFVSLSSVKDTFVGAYELFPGRNFPSKLAIFSTATSAAALAISKEWYIVDDETTVSVLTCTIFIFLYRTFKDKAQEFLASQNAEDENLFLSSYKRFSEGLTASLEHHKIVLQSPAIVREFHSIQQVGFQVFVDSFFICRKTCN